jgi:peptidoglycan/LPS O-acetylase OafA/YrhL
MEQARNSAVDAFRGVAVLAVIAFHYSVRWAPPDYSSNLYGYHATAPRWLELGQHGVELFFVISGLVITMTVSRSASASDFLLRRAARLWPALVACCTLTWILTSLVGPEAFRRSPADYVASLTFFASQFHRQPVDGAYWSLAVEVKFYLWVAAAFLFLRGRFWIAVGVLAGLSGVAALSRHGASLLEAAYWPYFICGMCGWYGLFEHRPLRALLLGGEAALLFVIDNPGLASSLLLIVAVATMFATIAMDLQVPLLAGLGRVSYSLYLLHQFLGVMLIGGLTRIGVPDLLAALLTLAVLVGLAALSFRFVEEPGARLIRRLGSSAGRSAPLPYSTPARTS